MHCVGCFHGSIVFVGVVTHYAGVNGLFVVHLACYHPALRACLNLPHSHRLQMSMSGLDRVDKGWHSVNMDCTSITENDR